jgi:hypothetical protein
MTMNPGFYKFDGERLSYASTSVYAPNYTLLADDRDSVTFPFNGWMWFDTLSEAEVYFGINGNSGDWIEFGTALAFNEAFNDFIREAAQTAPILERMITVGLGQAAQGDFRTFLRAWSLGVSAEIIPPDLQQHLIGLASQYQLPPRFIDGL